MALKIEIDGADDILQFVKVLFVSSEIIQKQIHEKASIEADDDIKNGAKLELIHDVIVDIGKTVGKLHETKNNPEAKKPTVRKPRAKKIITHKEA